MNPEDDNYPESPPKPSTATDEPETKPSLLGFPSGSLFVDTTSASSMAFAGSPLSFPIEFDTFSPINPSPSASGGSQTANFAAAPLTGIPPHPGATSGGDTEAAARGVPQPMDCLQGSPVPPFLSKTFDLVDDRSLDPIISWGPTGESFVVWDPVEFSRLILPMNFKHNNFSSFVRQLNTYGFRKIDTDRWEFANEAFQQGKRHLLKTIQRRKSPHSQQVGSYIGPSSETGKSRLEDIEKLRKERSVLMQEIVELQQQHQGTVHHMETVNQRVQAAEQRQKQMVSFLAKLLQNPAFAARLQQRKKQGEIGSSRPKKKFVRHQQHELAKLDPPMERQIVKYKPDWRNLNMHSVGPELDRFPVGQSSDYPLQGMVGSELGLDPEGLSFQIDNVALDETAVSDELAHSVQVGEGTSSLGSEDPFFKGKNVMSTQGVSPEYFISFPEDLVKEKNLPGFSSPGIESIANQEELWSMGFCTTAGMSSSANELWGDVVQDDVPELGAIGGLSEIWDLGSGQVPGGSGIHKGPAEFPSVESESHAGQPKDDRV